jgi:hypothetical protein
MAAPQDASQVAALRARMQDLGRAYARREADHAEAMERAKRCAARLRSWVADALAGFDEAAAAAGAQPLGFQVSETRIDDKHVRAVQFEIRRGRHVAVVTVKSRGEVTLVGPFHAGKKEGPCFTFPADADDELRRALGDFLERYVDEAIAP